MADCWLALHTWALTKWLEAEPVSSALARLDYQCEMTSEQRTTLPHRIIETFQSYRRKHVHRKVPTQFILWYKLLFTIDISSKRFLQMYKYINYVHIFSAAIIRLQYFFFSFQGTFKQLFHFCFLNQSTNWPVWPQVNYLIWVRARTNYLL